jgi:hypothetical protein
LFGDQFDEGLNSVKIDPTRQSASSNSLTIFFATTSPHHRVPIIVRVA